jgi:hypothetical protein
MLVLLRLSRWVGGTVVVHHPILRRSTTERSSHNLPLLGFLVGVDGVIHDHDVADELLKCPSSLERYVLLRLGGETYHEAVLLLLIGVHLVRCILRQIVELLGVVVHEPSSLLDVHELLSLLPHHTCGDVVGAKSITELSPRHSVIRGVSVDVVGPPCASVTPQLLRGEEVLLHFRAAQEPILGLHHLEPVVGLKRLSCLGEERRMRSREVAVGGWSWSWSISCPVATTGGVGNELPHQLGLLIMGLKDRGDRLSQTWRWRRIPVPL